MILVDEKTRVLVQGITGREATYHTLRCIEYGTQVVAGVTPGKGGSVWEGKVPVFESVELAKSDDRRYRQASSSFRPSTPRTPSSRQPMPASPWWCASPTSFRLSTR